MSAERVIASLLRIAKEELDGARLLAAGSNRNAIYHCEQAAEKLIKAVLTSESIHAGIGHDLERMIDGIPDANPLKPTLRSLAYLSSYATTYRYPTTSGRIKPAPSASEVASAIAAVDGTLRELAKRFGVDLDDVVSPAQTAAPIR